MKIFNKFKGTKGFVSLWERVIRFRYMITDEAKRRAEILAFWEKHGREATEEAFKVTERTLYRWQRAIREGHGKLEALNKQSTAPKRRRKRIIPDKVKELILTERSHEKIGKEKLAILLKEDGVADLSPSTVGRMLGDMKKQGLLSDPVRYSLFGKTGNMIEKKPKQYKKKLRSTGHEGGLVKADTIVRFTNGIKRYVLTAIDKETKFTFAYAYTSHSSKPAADFMEKFKSVAPLSLTHVQTDNGSEFAEHFEAYLKDEGIVHFHAYPRTPKMQSEIERFNRTLSEAFIERNRYLLAYDIDAFNKELIDWLLWYNTRRPHWSLGLVSPLRYIVSTLPAPDCQMWWTNTQS
jgi:transposase InsO family protein